MQGPGEAAQEQKDERTAYSVLGAVSCALATVLEYLSACLSHSQTGLRHYGQSESVANSPGALTRTCKPTHSDYAATAEKSCGVRRMEYIQYCMYIRTYIHTKYSTAWWGKLCKATPGSFVAGHQGCKAENFVFAKAVFYPVLSSALA